MNGTYSMPACAQPGNYSPYGIVIDGVWSALAGQPPIASSKGWGNLGWMRSR
jgi:hypothetical protein